VQGIIAPTLEGRYARIEPLELRHAPGLFAIGTDPSIWDWLVLEPFKKLADAQRYIEDALTMASDGSSMPFAVIDVPSDLVAGTTRYLEIRPVDRAIEIGWTWYAVARQRTALNTECKLLLLTHAFEVLGAHRVQFKTDSRNVRSRRAIERLGASAEGILRCHMIVLKNGDRRDSAYYSIVLEEWPSVRTRLQGLLAAR
jgi:RimJ/RimL family protein N-acetyltransferase